MDRLAAHAKAVNLAKRYSVQNENDLMMVRLCCEAMCGMIGDYRIFFGCALTPLRL